jgi:hypothetical protein
LLSTTACYGGLDANSSSGGGEGNGEGGSDEGTEELCDPDAPDGAVRHGRKLSRLEYRNVIEDVLDVPPSDEFPGPLGVSQSGYSTEPALNLVGEVTVESLMHAAEDVAEALPAGLGERLPCATSAQDTACVDEYLATVGRRLFRRSLTEGERNMLVAIYESERADEASFGDAVAVMTAQMLQMPAFLYVMEAPADDDEARPLTGIELASRLSFYMWNSAPDDALLDRAESGDLEDPEAIAEEAARMFEDPRASRGFARFFREWVQIEMLELSNKDAATFPYLNPPLVTAVNESFERYVTDAARSGMTLGELLTDPSTYVNADLAPLLDSYGMDASDDWERVDMPEDRFAGIVTQPAFLAGLAHSTEASYVLRGRFVRKRLLCDALPPPPGDAMSAFAELDKPEDPTARDLSNIVREQAECKSCHDAIDPVGLAFENFDAMGAWRDEYLGGKSIDPADVVVVGEDEIEFTDHVDLMRQLSEREDVLRCFARQVYRYEASRLDTKEDACNVAQVSEAMMEADGRLDEAFLAVTRTEGFMYRRGE